MVIIERPAMFVVSRVRNARYVRVSVWAKADIYVIVSAAVAVSSPLASSEAVWM